MTALPRRRRLRTALVVFAAFATVVTAVIAGRVGARALGNYTGAKNAASETPVLALPDTPTAMLATINDANELTSVAILVLSKDGQGGSIVPVPISVDASGTYGDLRQPLYQLYQLGGVDQLQRELSNVLALDIRFSAVLTPEGLVQLLSPVAPIGVDLPTDVSSGDGTTTQVVVPMGQQTLTADDAAAVLLSTVPTLSDRTRRDNINALWKGFATTIGAGRLDGQLPAVVTTFDELWIRLLAGPLQARGLLADRIDAAKNPNGLDVELLNIADATLVFASISPSAMSSPQTGQKYRLVAPPGNEQRVADLIQVIQFLQGNVVSVSFDGPVQVQTDVLLSERQTVDPESFRTLLGEVAFPAPTTIIDGVDITLVLGSSYLNAPPTVPAASTTSTSQP